MKNSIVFFFFIVLHLKASIFYVDPINGSMDGDGSINAPFPRVQYLLDNALIQSYEPVAKPYKWNAPLKIKNSGSPIKARDTIMCYSGYQGTLSIIEYYNDEMITIMPVEGHRVMFRNIHIRAASKWRIQGVEVSPSFHPFFTRIVNIVNLESHNFTGPVSDIEISNCRIFSYEDIYSWSADDWLEKVGSGISAAYYSRRFKILNNDIFNVDFGISIATDGALVQGNSIINFSGDALRGNGSNMTFDQNVIMNNYKVDDNHDDAFQGFNFGIRDTFRNVRLTRNLVIQNADPLQPNSLKGSLQGLAFFDGNIKNWYVANNIIIVDHYHGISLYGCHECQVVNNTVIDQRPGNKPKPWILVRSKKSGDPIKGNIIVNNIATKVILSDDTDPLVRNNLILEGNQYNENFADPSSFDFHLKPTSRAIDKGLVDFAPPIDFYGNSRPYGKGSEIGAVECVDACVSTANIIINEGDKGMALFPNPVASDLNITFKGEDAEISIFNQLGQLVFQSFEINDTAIDVSFLAIGLYHVRLRSKRGYQMGQFIKL